jgi:hypothetical protein
MRETHMLRCYEYVHRPYEAIRALLQQDTVETLQRATSSAAARAECLATTLSLAAAGFVVGVNVRVRVQSVHQEPPVAGLPPVTTIRLTWAAEKTPSLFPSMDATLSIAPVSASETRLVLEGDYRPPLGMLGRAVDALALHHVAEATVHKLVHELAVQLGRETSSAPSNAVA